MPHCRTSNLSWSGGLLAGALFLATSTMTGAQGFKLSQTSDAVVVRDAKGLVALEYHLKRPAGSDLVVDSGDFFHPLTTPSGVVVTDLVPSDHKHHRGVFLAFVEMHGNQDADFWGWGEHAPIKDRRIVNRRIIPTAAPQQVKFVAGNEWMADGEVLVDENVNVLLTDNEGMRVLDLTYTLTPRSDLTLTRWAFSGFCVRVRKDAEVLGVFSPAGKSELPNPSHLQPDSDWPDAPWYAFSQKLPDGRVFGAAVINDPKNPPTLWHNHRDIRMLNPCIVAPAEVKLEKGRDLVLRYRVVTFDGEVPDTKLNKLTAAH